MLDDNTYYNKEHNLEYWHIPKNAMTSIRMQLSFSWTSSSQLPHDRKIFTVIRNPFDRLLSSYLMCRDVLYGPGPSLYNVRDINPSSDMFNTNKDIVKGYQEYINEIAENGPFDAHNLTQMHFIKDKLVIGNGNYLRQFHNITDFILFENLNEGLSKLHNKKIVLKKTNQSKPLSDDTKELLRKVSHINKDKILSIYGEDYKLYNKIKNG